MMMMMIFCVFFVFSKLNVFSEWLISA